MTEHRSDPVDAIVTRTGDRHTTIWSYAPGIAGREWNLADPLVPLARATHTLADGFREVEGRHRVQRFGFQMVAQDAARIGIHSHPAEATEIEPALAVHGLRKRNHDLARRHVADAVGARRAELQIGTQLGQPSVAEIDEQRPAAGQRPHGVGLAVFVRSLAHGSDGVGGPGIEVQPNDDLSDRIGHEHAAIGKLAHRRDDRERLAPGCLRLSQRDGRDGISAGSSHLHASPRSSARQPPRPPRQALLRYGRLSPALHEQHVAIHVGSGPQDRESPSHPVPTSRTLHRGITLFAHVD